MDSYSEKFKTLRFGTSGLRDTVENMTDMECYINTKGFLGYLKGMGEFDVGTVVAVGGDRRPSTLRIKRAVAAAVKDMGGKIDDQGLTSTPALTYYAMQRKIPSIMVTGSHIPAGRNGIKFTKAKGEILKTEEEGILGHVAEERATVYAMLRKDSPFNQDNGMFKRSDREKTSLLVEEADASSVCMKEYADRYKRIFEKESPLSRTKLFFYEHSAVARDLAKDLFEALGARVVAPDEKISIDYIDEKGERLTESVELRSRGFVAVDTESVSSRTLSIFEKVMNEKDLDVGCTMDGDSDRPLLVYRLYRDGHPTREIRYITGDILGLLTVLALKAMGVEVSAVAVPISANDAVLKVLKESNVEVTQTKIGSPYVVAAMLESLKRHTKKRYPVWNIFSWESNGGFLMGNDITIRGETLKALPTRDSVLPILAVLWLAENQRVPVSHLISQLPKRFTHADRLKQFPTEKGRAIIESMSPVEQTGVMQVDYLKDGGVEVSYLDGTRRTFPPKSEFQKIREQLEGFFTSQEGFSGVSRINYIDGVRIFFSNGEISHFRPSGNAPEFRNYAISDSLERSKAIVETGLKKIIPRLAKKLVSGKQ